MEESLTDEHQGQEALSDEESMRSRIVLQGNFSKMFYLILD